MNQDSLKSGRRKLALFALLMASLLFLGFLSSRPFANPYAAPHAQQLSMSADWDAKVKNEIRSLLSGFEADAFVALHGEQLIMSEGDFESPSNVASVRKSIMSGLYGIAVQRGLVDLDETLQKLGIDERKSPLTELEKSATVRDLLMSRSGIYLRSIGESAKMEKSKPPRGSHSPGSFFYYNNWDFNALGTIFEQKTQLSIGQAFYEWIAVPTGMRHFHPSHVTYETSEKTDHRMYRFYLSAEDLARFGALYVHGGRWQGIQIIPQDWIAESTAPYSEVSDVQVCDGYSYLWWTDSPTETLWAIGSGGQFLVVDPNRQLVLVATNNTGRSPLESLVYRIFGAEATFSEASQLYRCLLKQTLSL